MHRTAPRGTGCLLPPITILENNTRLAGLLPAVVASGLEEAEDEELDGEEGRDREAEVLGPGLVPLATDAEGVGEEDASGGSHGLLRDGRSEGSDPAQEPGLASSLSKPSAHPAAVGELGLLVPREAALVNTCCGCQLRLSDSRAHRLPPNRLMPEMRAQTIQSWHTPRPSGSKPLSPGRVPSRWAGAVALGSHRVRCAFTETVRRPATRRRVAAKAFVAQRLCILGRDGELRKVRKRSPPEGDKAGRRDGRFSPPGYAGFSLRA